MKTDGFSSAVALAFATLLSLTVLVPAHAEAQTTCNQSAASAADSDLWSTHGCWEDFFLWQYATYRPVQADFQSQGWTDACNQNMVYPKHWNASYLVTYGMGDDYGQSFHGTWDYRAAAEARSSEYHASLRHRTDPTVTGAFGAMVISPLGDDGLYTYCPLYNPTAMNANPASRAGDYMHEATHNWMAYRGYDSSHLTNPPSGGNCAAAVSMATACDYFYFHGVGAYDFGADYGYLWYEDGTAAYFHSPNQVQVEFLCDVADVPRPWVPASVRMGASADANQRAMQRFINGPGYTCGSPRPWE